MFAGFSNRYLLGMGLWAVVLCLSVFLLLKRRQKLRIEKKNLLPVNLLLSFCTVLIFLFMAELSFALLYLQTDANNATNASRRWFQLYIENQRNKYGARDNKEFVRKLPEGQKRIIFIGDSFTVGHGIENMEDRFSNLVEAKLEKQYPGKFQVTNMGDPGLEIAQIEGRIWGVLGEGNQVDYVIYVMCPNDIEGYNENLLNSVKKAKSRYNIPLLTGTYLFNWLYFRYVQATSEELNDYFPELVKTYDSFAWDRFRRKLDQLDEDCEMYNAKLAIVVFPFLHDLKTDSMFVPIYEKMVKYGKEKGIPLVNLEPVMREHAEESLMVNRFDSHPNELANRYAAEEIYKKLVPILNEESPDQSSQKEDQQ